MLILGHRQNITEIFLGKETFNYIIMFKPPCNIIYIFIYIYNIANVLELLDTIINPFLTHVRCPGCTDHGRAAVGSAARNSL